MIEWNLDQFLALLAAGIIGLVALIWSYSLRSPMTLRGARKFAALLFKALGLILIITYLLEPRAVKTRVSPGENSFVVLYDNSASMNLVDQPGSVSRGAKLNTIISEAYQPNGDGWRDRLETWFKVHDYQSGDRLESVSPQTNLDFSSSASPLFGSLNQILTRFKNRDLAGILVLSDGSATDLDFENNVQWNSLPPVYVAALGDPPTTSDISIQRTHVTQTVFENAPVIVKVDGKVYGSEYPDIQVDLIDSAGAIVQSQTVPTSRKQSSWVARFSFKPDPELPPFHHVRAYNVGLANVSDLYQVDQPGSQESTYWNNFSLFAVNSPKGPFRILYVSGRPNWEFKFLNRSIDEDPELSLSALIRVAKREPKFEFRGRGNSSANPLFQGLDDPAVEETRRYDEPVLTRINVLNEEELKDGFPKFKEDLYKFDGLILDDVEAEFFTRDQLYLIREFVARRGGGFLMLGGQESFAKGGYAGTPMEDILPFYLSDSSATQSRVGATQWKFTEPGWQEAWSRTQATQDAEKAWLEFSPEWGNFNRVGRPKPAASLLAVLEDQAGNQFPALGIQNYGAGKSAALTLARFWRTQFRTPVDDSGFEKRWRQMARWLTVDVPSRLQMQIQQDHQSGVSGMQIISSKVLDKEFEPDVSSEVSVEVSEYQFIDGRFEQVTDRQNWRLPVFQGELAHEKVSKYLPGSAGGFLVESVASDANGIEIDREKSSWVTHSFSEELSMLEPNHDLLKRIAAKSGGRFLEIDDLNDWSQTLDSVPAPKSVTYSVPLWHGPWPLLAALICLLAEWRIRRKNMAA